MNNKIPQPILDQALEWVMEKEIRKLEAENQVLRDEIREMDEIEGESNAGRSG